MLKQNKFRYFLFMPSFYALLTMPFFYFLYLIDLIPMEEKNSDAQFIFISAILMFLSFTLLFYKLYLKQIKNFEQRKTQPASLKFKTIILFFLFIGLLGSFKYVIDFSAYLGGLEVFFLALIVDSGQIRIAAEHTTSIGFQIVYFCWIAAAAVLLEINLKFISRWFLILFIFILLVNVLFIDRTRPLWILFTSFCLVFFYRQNQFSSSFIRNLIIIIGVSFVTLFIIIGNWMGKVTSEDGWGKTIVPIQFQQAVLYGSSPFAYFNRIVESKETYNYEAERIIYPAKKIMAMAGLGEEPPPQILEFYFIPQPVNTGTFLEPFYRDGGILFCVVGMLLHTFFFNLLGLFFIKYSTRLGMFALANLCFANFFAFFTPKFHNLPFWIFLFLGITTSLYELIKEKQFLIQNKKLVNSN